MQKEENTGSFSIAFFITALAIVAVVALAIIAYRIESAMQVDPIVIFTLTNHMDGHFTYTIFNMKMELDLSGIYGYMQRANDFQALIPSQVKGFLQLVSATMDTGYEQIQKLF